MKKILLVLMVSACFLLSSCSLFSFLPFSFLKNVGSKGDSYEDEAEGTRKERRHLSEEGEEAEDGSDETSDENNVDLGEFVGILFSQLDEEAAKQKESKAAEFGETTPANTENAAASDETEDPEQTGDPENEEEDDSSAEGEDAAPDGEDTEDEAGGDYPGRPMKRFSLHGYSWTVPASWTYDYTEDVYSYYLSGVVDNFTRGYFAVMITSFSEATEEDIKAFREQPQYYLRYFMDVTADSLATVCADYESIDYQDYPALYAPLVPDPDDDEYQNYGHLFACFHEDALVCIVNFCENGDILDFHEFNRLRDSFRKD